MPTDGGHGKIVWWLMGLLAASILAVAGTMAQHTLAQQEEVLKRLSVLEASHAAQAQARRDADRRLDRMEQLLEDIRERIRKLY